MWLPGINWIFGVKRTLFHKFRSKLTKLTPFRAHVEFSVFRDPDKLFAASFRIDLSQLCKNKQTSKTSQSGKSILAKSVI